MPRVCVFTAFFLSVCISAQDRIPGSIDASRKTPLRGGAPGLARAEFDRGPVELSRKLGYVTMHLAPTAAQQAELETLLEQQRDPASPNYRKWLAPEQFAERFGASRGDIAKVAQWLESEGLTVERQSRGRNWIAFSGTAAAVGRALQTEFHRYVIHGHEHFANSTAPSVPAALDGIVTGFVGLNDFGSNIQPHITTPGGTNSIAPSDIATIYDIAPLYNMGIDGAGQTIAIAGESELEPNLTFAVRGVKAR
jgi:subtilase family serine protease